jgi:hypothetical protein
VWEYSLLLCLCLYTTSRVRFRVVGLVDNTSEFDIVVVSDLNGILNGCRSPLCDTTSLGQFVSGVLVNIRNP